MISKMLMWSGFNSVLVDFKTAEELLYMLNGTCLGPYYQTEDRVIEMPLEYQTGDLLIGLR